MIQKISTLNILRIFLCVSLVILSFTKTYANEETQYYFDRSIYSEAYKSLPKILTQEDIIKYYNAYIFQKEGKFAESDETISAINNKILVGYIYYIRYLQTSYKPTFEELKNWLEQYSDLAVASLVYKKAQSLSKNRSQTLSIKKPKSFYDRFIPIYQRHDIFKDVEPLIPNNNNIKINITSNKITNNINKQLKAGKNFNAKQILLSPNAIKSLNHDTYDYYASILSKSYFLDGDDEQAIFWARRATKRNPDAFSEATFTMGLAYYRLKEYSKSSAAFKKIMKEGVLPDDTVSKAAYWNARVSLILGDIQEYYNSLKLASIYIYNFYGVIASEELGISPKYTWNYLTFPKNSISILEKNAYSRRALALLQFGLSDWAEQELIFLANYDSTVMNKNDEINTLNALIYMAQQVPMPALGLKFAGQQGMYYGLSHLSYPIFFVELQTGYELDPALLLAIMRRESSFYTGAMSGPGATGLMQIMPKTAEYVIKKYDLDNDFNQKLTSPAVSISIGQQYVKQLINVTDGNLIYVLGGFNGGSYNIDRWKIQKHRKPEDPLFFIESIPYKETRNYIKYVTTDYWIYQYKLGLEHYALYSIVQGGQPIYYNIDQETISKLKNFSYKPN